MKNPALIPDQVSAQVYILFRVFNLSKDSLNVKIYVDPQDHRERGELVFSTQTWTITPQ